MISKKNVGVYNKGSLIYFKCGYSAGRGVFFYVNYM